MRRLNGAARAGWKETNSSLGLVYDGESYWSEGPYYEFGLDEILLLEEAAARLQRMCVAAGDHIAARCPRSDAGLRASAYLDSVCHPASCLLSRIGVPEHAHEQVIRTWHDASETAWGTDFSPNIYGRFDIWYAGAGTTPKLLEYNAQTPTSLLEAAVVQWQWQEQTRQAFHPDKQWTSIHERLIDAWRRNLALLAQARPHLGPAPTIHFAYDDREQTGEDLVTVGYLMDTAQQAGFPTRLIPIREVGLDMADGRFHHAGQHIDVIFILYPWEWLWFEEGGKQVFLDLADPSRRGTVWIEPPWTAALWSNKALLPVLWELFPGDDLLLPAYFESTRPAAMTSYARKPIWSREGANIELVRVGETIARNSGHYGDGAFIYQELRELPSFDGHHPVLGVWMIDGEPAGMGIREGGLITRNDSRFVPHVIG
ncbi:glutathionylspermidine synthase family protein [Allorhizocola rhizosphaerae]|uniref:glutathionylspermidine synthase family protein n=1 Tax=Allorhizocola rhizosphaerae TaxID=1872709 RepID=UPI001478365B|nr:glutathionylspermidine synthase family protein [Allorhizocola rhizosphaerae]